MALSSVSLKATAPILPLGTCEVRQPVIADTDQQDLPEPNGDAVFSSESIPPWTREHWMRRANQVLADLASPCPFAAFASVVINHTDTSFSPPGELNSASQHGNLTLHGEMDAINRCSEALQGPRFGLTPAAALLAFRDLTLYTNGEPCPMCASAIRWAGFRECVYGTSIEMLVRLGWSQIGVSGREVFARSGHLPTTTTLVPDVLAAEIDLVFSWQFDGDTPCPQSCIRDGTGRCVQA